MLQQLKNNFIALFFIALLSSLGPFLAIAADPTNIVELEENPSNSFLVGSALYVISTEKNRMYVVNTTSNTFYRTFNMDNGPTVAIVHNDKIYVANSQDRTVYVYYSTGLYKTATTVGAGPIGLLGVGSRVYALSFDDSISVIENTGDSVLKKVVFYAGGTPSPFSTLLGNRIFIHHPNSNSISVFNTGTNSIVKNFTVGMGPQSSVLVGKLLYVINSNSNDISVVNTDTYEISTTIAVGIQPFSGLLIGSKLYVLNKGDNSLSLIDTTKNTLTKTITVGKQPVSMVRGEDFIYVMNLGDDTVSVLDTKTDTVMKTVVVGDEPLSGTFVGKKLYVNNSKSKNLSMIDTVAPGIVSFTSPLANGSYSEDTKIRIEALFNQYLSAGSIMTIVLDNNKEINLTSVDSKTLFGEYIVQSGEDSKDLTIKSIKSAKIVGLFGLDGTSYTLPTGKNLGDSKNIVVKTSGVTLSSAETCSPYRLCPLSTTLQNISDYQTNLICEGFITKAQVQRNMRRISRLEVLQTAVNMLRTEKAPYAEYENTYTDIVLRDDNQETVSLIQTALKHGLISPNNGAFEASKSITRIEAYALLMRGVCLAPNAVEAIDARTIHQLAVQKGITDKPWARFRAQDMMTRSEVFILTSRLADWADTNGGCQALTCTK